MAAYVPASVANVIYECFASKTLTLDDPKIGGFSKGNPFSQTQQTSIAAAQSEVPFVMTFDDFTAMYVCLRDKRDEEFCQIVFAMFKLGPEYINRQNKERDKDVFG